MKKKFWKLKKKKIMSRLLLCSMLLTSMFTMPAYATEATDTDQTEYSSTREYIEAEYTKTEDITDWADDSQANYRIAEGSTDTDYMLTAAKWTDRVKGEAEITMAGRTEEPSVALYVFTTCFHGSSSMTRQQVVSKDIKALANAYDRVDVIVIDGPEEWAELEDYPGHFGGIHEVKEFTSENASTASTWVNSEVTKWVGAHFTGNVPAAIRKYLFGTIDGEISTKNMVHRPSAIYVSADMHYLTNSVAADTNEEASRLAEYATEEFFDFLTEHYLGTTKRYFTSSQTGQKDSPKYLLVKKMSIYDAEYMKVVAGVFNPNLYSEGATMVNPWSGTAPSTDVTSYALTSSKFASDYNYSQDILSAGIRLPDKQMALENTVADDFEIVSATAFTTNGMNVDVTIDGQTVRATAESFLTGDEITLKIKVKLKTGQSRQYADAIALSDSSYMLDGDTEVLESDSTLLSPITENVNISLVWDDDNNRDGIRPETANIVLVGSDGSRYKAEINDGAIEPIKFSNLIKYQDGEEITYSLELENATGYQVKNMTWNFVDEVQTASASLFHKPATKSITIKENWEDHENVDGLRPKSTTVSIVGSDGSTFSKQLYADSNWTAVADNLYAYYDHGKEMQYSLQDTETDGYTTSVECSEDGSEYVIINTHAQEKRSLAVSLNWDDDEDRDGVRPKKQEVTLNGSDGSSYSATLTEDNSWSYEFSDIPTNSGGEAIVYTLTETAPSGYTGKILVASDTKGFAITNTHKTEKQDITVTGTWNDDENRDGERPNKVKVTLKGTDGSSRTLSISADNDWKVTYTDLPVNYDGGKAITYSLAEFNVAEYSAKTVTANDKTDFHVTFTHTPLRRDITIYKKWDDGDDADSMRRDSEFILTGSDGLKYTCTIKKDSADQEYTFKNLYVCSDGEEVTYTLTEKEMDGYTSEIKQAKGGFIVINTHKVTPKAQEKEQNYEDGGDDGIIQKIVSIPKTGDDSKILLYAGLGVLALGAGIATGIFTIKKRKRDKK